jgi:hypothetical protein
MALFSGTMLRDVGVSEELPSAGGKIVRTHAASSGNMRGENEVCKDGYVGQNVM